MTSYPGLLAKSKKSRDWSGLTLTANPMAVQLTWRLSDLPDGQASAPLDRVLEALANPHRREIVYVLGLQPYAIHQLAQMRGLSLPAIHKHIKVLENAGLISRRKQGRTNYLTLNPQPLRQLQDWVGQFHTYWGNEQATFENYDQHLGIVRDIAVSESSSRRKKEKP